MTTKADEEERRMYFLARENLRAVGGVSPEVLGLDTSLAHVALSLARRNPDSLASKSSYFEKKPRKHPLESFPSSSRPMPWWNLKYKTRWLSDGSLVSGNPILTNFLWNEIGRGTDLKDLEDWTKANKGIVQNLTAFIFSLKNIFDKSTWSPLPSGDGQRISIRAQTNGSFFQNYSFSFTEPWLGGKKPNSLNFSAYHSIQDYSTDVLDNRLDIIGLNLGLGKRLRWPDDYFSLSQSISIQQYKLKNRTLVDGFSNGISKNISYRTTFSRSSIFDPIFPKTVL